MRKMSKKGQFQLSCGWLVAQSLSTRHPRFRTCFHFFFPHLVSVRVFDVGEDLEDPASVQVGAVVVHLLDPLHDGLVAVHHHGQVIVVVPGKDTAVSGWGSGIKLVLHYLYYMSVMSTQPSGSVAMTALSLLSSPKQQLSLKKKYGT